MAATGSPEIFGARCLQSGWVHIWRVWQRARSSSVTAIALIGSNSSSWPLTASGFAEMTLGFGVSRIVARATRERCHHGCRARVFSSDREPSSFSQAIVLSHRSRRSFAGRHADSSHGTRSGQNAWRRVAPGCPSLAFGSMHARLTATTSGRASRLIVSDDPQFLHLLR